MHFEIVPPQLDRWRAGNTGVPGVWQFRGAEAGLHTMVCALVHGNELCGAWAVSKALQAIVDAGHVVKRGWLTLALCNLDAFDRFDASRPDESRCVDEDMNRLWGARIAVSKEGARVAQLRPFVEAADRLLDLHSMHEAGPPLGLVGAQPRHLQLALALGAPALLVADSGHAAGTRLRDHGRFGEPSEGGAQALLVECGWHGHASSVALAEALLGAFCVHTGAWAGLPAGWVPLQRAAQTLLRVERTVTVRPGPPPVFARAWVNGQTLPQRGTLIGHNGGEALLTPFDHCTLIMPTLRHARVGATLVRLARQAVPGRAPSP